MTTQAAVGDDVRERVENVCRDMEYAVAQGMSWISHGEAVEFVKRLRAAIASVPPVPIDDGWQPDELVSRWQGERHEWFKRDIAEIVEDFAKWLLASLHPNQPGDR
jgi:hypothetical protein